MGGGRCLGDRGARLEGWEAGRACDAAGVARSIRPSSPNRVTCWASSFCPRCSRHRSRTSIRCAGPRPEDANRRRPTSFRRSCAVPGARRRETCARPPLTEVDRSRAGYWRRVECPACREDRHGQVAIHQGAARHRQGLPCLSPARRRLGLEQCRADHRRRQEPAGRHAVRPQADARDAGRRCATRCRRRSRSARWSTPIRTATTPSATSCSAGREIVTTKACAEEMLERPPEALAAMIRNRAALGDGGKFLYEMMARHFEWDDVVYTAPTRTFDRQARPQGRRQAGPTRRGRGRRIPAATCWSICRRRRSSSPAICCS